MIVEQRPCMADAFNSAWLLVKDSDHPLDFPDDVGMEDGSLADVDTGRRALDHSIRSMPGGDSLVGPKLEDILEHTEHEGAHKNVYEEELFGEDGDGDSALYEQMFQAYLDSQREKEMAEGIKDPRDKGDRIMPKAKTPTFRELLASRSKKKREAEEPYEEPEF